MIHRMLSTVRASLSLVLIIGAFAWACASVVARHEQANAPGTITLVIGHWQLETSAREAFDQLAADYRRDVNPNVRIEQIVVPDSMYGQWASTQLSGDTAPDLMECLEGHIPRTKWISYLARYFVPLSDVVQRANPYDAGTPLAGVPLAQTYKDDMRYGYIDELQQYMVVPLSQFAVRVFYNRDLLKRLTGRDVAPTNYREFLEVCRQIASKRDEHGHPFTPIACAGASHFPSWEQLMFDAPTYGAMRLIDFNRDGCHTPEELYIGIETGKISFDFPGYRAKFQMIREMTPYFQNGFTGLSRDEAVFLFAQQHAVFIPTGTWDARSLQEQARGRFSVGISNFPVPDKTDPEFGPYIDGPVYDMPMIGISFGVARSCKHQDVAIDFLRYLTSQRGNEKFNRIVGWIPTIRDTSLDPFLAAFEPRLFGVFTALDPKLGAESMITWNQLESLFEAGQIDYDEFAKRFTKYELERGPREFAELQRDWQRDYVIDEGIAASMRAQALLSPPAQANAAWINYRALIATQQIGLAIDHARKAALLRGIGIDAPAPYDIRPDAMQAARRQALATGTAQSGATR